MKQKEQLMKKFFSKIWVKFVEIFGSIKIFRFPLFIVYDPSEYEMNGVHIQEALNALQPGDIILRGYNHYLDGYFVDDPHGYSHGAIYVGNDIIIHAIAKGVSEIHAIDFMKCDRICILRPISGQNEAIEIAKNFAKENIPYDFHFHYGTSALYCFELCAFAYPNLDVKRIKFKKMLGLLKRNAYLADSFRQNKNFKIVFEFNPKYDVDSIA